ncbi:MAG: YsnF/AvaK domain-containing protein [Bacillota bacterium]|nr:YsnF/AvaK domain-containing protein [Bacillota bacterium]
MGDFFGIFGDDDKKKDIEKTVDTADTVEDGKLRLKEEELDVAKNRVQTGDVTLRKEIVEEQKTIDVPVTHEEVIIERRAINKEPSDSPITNEETIRIPVSEEQVDIGKHTVVTGEVIARKREVEENRHIEETVKKEEARIDKNGDPNIISDDTTGGFR